MDMLEILIIDQLQQNSFAIIIFNMIKKLTNIEMMLNVLIR